MNKALNVSCNLNGCLVCQIPDNMVEVELKVKTTMGKYTLIKDAYTIPSFNQAATSRLVNWRNEISIATSKSNKSQKDNEKGDKNVMEEIPNNKIIIKGFKTISQEESNKM